MPPSCCAACATTCGRSPMRRGSSLDANGPDTLHGRRRCGQGSPHRPEPAPQRAQVHARRQRRPRLGRGGAGRRAPLEPERRRTAARASTAGPGAPIVNSLNPAVADEPVDRRPMPRVAAAERRRRAADPPVARRRARPGDRQAPVRPARRRRRDRDRAPSRGRRCASSCRAATLPPERAAPGLRAGARPSRRRRTRARSSPSGCRRRRRAAASTTGSPAGHC